MLKKFILLKKFNSLNIIWIIGIVLLITIGVVMRTYLWLQGHSFYLDEGDLIVNFRNMSYLQLFGPMDFDEQAPPVFLIIGKFLYSVFGYNEILLRFLPYLAGCLALVLFFFLSKKVYKNYFPIFIAILLMSLNFRLIFYSQAFKQYSIEMLLAIIAAIIFLSIDFSKFNTQKSFIFGCIVAFSFWCSYTLVFIIAGFSLVYLIEALMEKNKDKIKNFAYYVIPIILGFMIFYYTNLYFVVGNKDLYTFWDRFTGFFPTSLDFISYIWNDNKLVMTGATSLLIIGMIRLYLDDKFKFWTILSPILMTLLAAALHIYPFGARLIVFMFPFIFLIAAKPFDNISLNNKVYSITVIILFLFTSNYYKLNEYRDIFLNKNYFKASTAREFIKILKKTDINKDEYLYVGVDPNGSINSYDEKQEIIDKVFIREHVIYEPKFHLNDSLKRIPKGAVVYFYLSEYHWCRDYPKYIWPWINEHCTILEKVEEKTGTFVKCKNNK